MLPILYRDEYIVVIDKPSGLLVHRSMIDKHETRFALQMTRDQIGQYVYPVHRLDKPTSGVLVMALSSEIAAKLNQQFTQKTITKNYIALVRGFTLAEGTIDYALKEVLDKMTDKRAQQDKPPQEAITHYKTLWQVEVPFAVGRYPTARYSLISLRPETGRKHQLRRHLKHIFHPIVGDTTHGDGKHNTMFRERFSLNRLLLVAKEMSFEHPVTGELIKLSASMGEEFEKVLVGLGCSLYCSDTVDHIVEQNVEQRVEQRVEQNVAPNQANLLNNQAN
ncbi:MAG: tRNA pseudouridine(65) synthase TruC [Gammaproteobacteria bacterium]|nr:MAG: tRNA pseudouridine(65) synthase TruC [Gammaproteobacteria bacterium]